MLQEEAWLRVAQECPRRIIVARHSSGVCRHGITARFPGKVLCCHREGPLPEDWTPTPAQAEAWQASGVTGAPPPG